MLDDFFSRYSDDDSEEQIVWETFRSRLDRLPPETRDAAFRCLTVHWFNAEILGALLQGGRLAQLGGAPEPAPPARAPALYAQLQALSSVEPYAERGHAFHKLTRQTGLQRLWQQEEALVRELNVQAAAYFDEIWRANNGQPDTEALVEWLYHLLIADEPQALENIDYLLGDPDVQLIPGLAQAIVSTVEERVAAGRLSSEAAMLLSFWHAQVASLAGETERARAVLDEFIAGTDVPDNLLAPAELLFADILYGTREYENAGRHYTEALYAYERLDRPEDQALTLLRLGDIAYAQDNFEPANDYYVAALQRYLPVLVVPFEEELEEAVFLNVYDPSAWHLEELVLTLEQEESNGSAASAEGVEEPLPERIFIYFVDVVDEEAGPSSDGEDGSPNDALTWPVEFTPLLAEIWLKRGLAALALDAYPLAFSCGRLAGEMAELLGDLYGSQRSVQLLRTVADYAGDRELSEWSINFQEEILESALEQGDDWTALETILNLADTALQVADRQQARAYYDQARDLGQALESATAQAKALEGLGRLAWLDGERAEAQRLFLQALALHRDADDREEEANLLVALGDLALARYRPDEARTHYEQAHEIFNERSLQLGLSTVTRRLGSLALDRFQYEKAETYLEEAIKLARQLKLRAVEAEGLVDLGWLNEARGRHSIAREHFREAIRIAGEIGRPAIEAKSLHGLGRVEATAEQWEEAVVHYRQAHGLYEDLEDDDGRLSVLLGMVDVNTQQKDFDAAIAAGQEGVTLAERIGDRSQRAYAHMQLAIARLEAGQHQEAIAHLRSAVELEPQDSTIVGNLGWALYEAGDYRGCLDYCRQALKLDPANSWHYRNIGHAHLALGEPDQAAAAYRKAINLRYEGEHFKETIKVIEKLLSERPDTPRGQEMLDLFRQTQAELEAADRQD